MRADSILTAHIDDIIFDGRNKSYGAYLLRQTYEKYMRRGVLGAVCILFSIISIPPMTRKASSETITGYTQAFVYEYVIEQDKKEKISTQPQKKSSLPTPPKSTIKYTQPVIVQDITDIKEESLPYVETLEKISINKSTYEGSDYSVEPGILDRYGDGIYALPSVDTLPIKEQVFSRVEQMPQFGSGDKELLEYVAQHIQYPRIAIENNIQGTVIVEFIVNEDGSIADPVILCGIGGGCDDEALRVVRDMPNWQPGKQQGQKVKVKFTLPIHFSLQ